MRSITRPLEAHAYGPGLPHHQGAPIRPMTVDHTAAPVGHVFMHPDGGGVTPLNSPHAPLYAADGAPFYNTGYEHPQQGPLLTGGFPSLRLPPIAAMIDLSDMSTWDRPVWILDAH